jgi:hypothetical protein
MPAFAQHHAAEGKVVTRSAFAAVRNPAQRRGEYLPPSPAGGQGTRLILVFLTIERF